MQDYTIPPAKDGVNEFPDDYREYLEAQERLAGMAYEDECFWEQLEQHFKDKG